MTLKTPLKIVGVWGGDEKIVTAFIWGASENEYTFLISCVPVIYYRPSFFLFNVTAPDLDPETAVNY